MTSNAEDELNEIELGDRPIMAMTAWQIVQLYPPDERVYVAVMHLTAEVAAATSWRGLPFPPDWAPYQSSKRRQDHS